MSLIFEFFDAINPWLILFVAIFSSAVGTTALKFFTQRKKPLFLPIIVIGYTIFLFLITLVMERIDISVGYAVWAGLSTALMTLSGVIFFHERLSPIKVASLLLIISGVVGLNLL